MSGVIGPSSDDVDAMFDLKFEVSRYGNVPLSVASGIWSQYCTETGVERGSALKFIEHFCASARKRNPKARRYGFSKVVGVAVRVVPVGLSES